MYMALIVLVPIAAGIVLFDQHIHIKQGSGCCATGGVGRNGCPRADGWRLSGS
jgi:hypothetical protein